MVNQYSGSHETKYNTHLIDASAQDYKVKLSETCSYGELVYTQRHIPQANHAVQSYKVTFNDESYVTESFNSGYKKPNLRALTDRHDQFAIVDCEKLVAANAQTLNFNQTHMVA